MARQITLITAMDAGILQDSGGLLAPGLMEGFDVPVLLILAIPAGLLFLFGSLFCTLVCVVV